MKFDVGHCDHCRVVLLKSDLLYVPGSMIIGYKYHDEFVEAIENLMDMVSKLERTPIGEVNVSSHWHFCRACITNNNERNKTRYQLRGKSI